MEVTESLVDRASKSEESASTVRHPQPSGQVKRKADRQDDSRVRRKKGEENAASSQSKFWTLDEAINSADGPFDYTGGSPDLSGPGDPFSKPTVVHNLAGK